MPVHEITIHVYPTDCDMLGHVNHATMITFLEHARWALIEPHVGVRDFMKASVWSVVRHVDISYHAQSLPGEDLVILSGLESVGRTSYTVRQEVRKGRRDGPLAADARIVFVCISREGRPVRVPAEWNAMFPHWPGAAVPAAAGDGA